MSLIVSTPNIFSYPKSFKHIYNKLHFDLIKEDNYLYCWDQNKNHFFYQTPYLKVFKNIHQINDQYYLILLLDIEEDDNNNEIYNFKYIMDKMYGMSQDEIKKRYKEIFPNTKGPIDRLTYESCIKRPFTGSRGQLLKLLISDDDFLYQKLMNLQNDQYVVCRIYYKGLEKLKGGKLIEEWVLQDFKTEEEIDQEQTIQYLNAYQNKIKAEIVNDDISVYKINSEDTGDKIEIESIYDIQSQMGEINIEENKNENKEINEEMNEEYKEIIKEVEKEIENLGKMENIEINNVNESEINLEKQDEKKESEIMDKEDIKKDREERLNRDEKKKKKKSKENKEKKEKSKKKEIKKDDDDELSELSDDEEIEKLYKKSKSKSEKKKEKN